jgi:hypothetical protein
MSEEVSSFLSGGESVKPVDQTTFGHPGGNCFSACVASMLGIAIEEVPYFMGDLDEPGHIWADRLDKWLAPRNLYALHFDMPTTGTPIWPDGFYILVGKSPRGDHAVIARAGKIVHDPHPSRDGLVAIEGFCLLLAKDLSP